MICRVLIEFKQNLSKNQDFKERKLLTFKLLIIIKDQLLSSMGKVCVNVKETPKIPDFIWIFSMK